MSNPPTYRKLDGSTWTPRPFVKSALDLAWMPIKIEHPGKIVQDETQTERIAQCHSEDRYLTRSIAMGLPLSKISLTDLSARIALETRIDCHLKATFPNPLALKQVDRMGKLKATHYTVQNLEQCFRDAHKWASSPETDSLVDALEREIEIPLREGSGEIGLVEAAMPSITAFNGDDNIATLTAYGTTRSGINTEKRGQVIERKKTASSILYVNYCQSAGRAPIGQIVNIVMDLYLSANGGWKYIIGGPRKTYISTNYLRPKLFGQAAKGADSEHGESLVTGRSNQLQYEACFLQPKERKKLHILHRIAFPQWYPKVSAVEALPGSMGGLSVPDARDPADIWADLPEEHRRLIEAAAGSDSRTAYKAVKILARARRSGTDVSDKTVDTLWERGQRAVLLWNSLAEEKDLEAHRIHIYSFDEARQEAECRLQERTLKNLSEVHSMSDLSSAVGRETSVYSKDVQGTLREHFISLDLYDREDTSNNIIASAAEGVLDFKKMPNPFKDHVRAVKRIQRSSFARSLPPSQPDPPPGKTPYEWMHGFTEGRNEKRFVRKEDFERIKPPETFSTRIDGSLLYGRAPDFHDAIAEVLPFRERPRAHRRVYRAHKRVVVRGRIPTLDPLRRDAYRDVLSDRLSSCSSAASGEDYTFAPGAAPDETWFDFSLPWDV